MDSNFNCKTREFQTCLLFATETNFADEHLKKTEEKVNAYFPSAIPRIEDMGRMDFPNKIITVSEGVPLIARK